MQTYSPARESDIFGNKFDVVSTVGYLIGVPLKNFGKEAKQLQASIFQELDGNKSARIIRHLSIVRTACLKHFAKLETEAKTTYRNIPAMHEWIPQDSIMQLCSDGIDVTAANCTKRKNNKGKVVLPPASVVEFVSTLNKNITDRFNNVRDLFPIWLNWEYIKDLFIFGADETSIRAEKNAFYDHMCFYPYTCYIHWVPCACGNLLYNDKHFVDELYKQHNDQFGDASRVKTVSAPVKDDIYRFIEDSQKIVLIVDCENSDAYKLCATLRDMDGEKRRKILKIILCDDEDFTPDAWRIFPDHIDIPLEHLKTERVIKVKSLLDIVLTTTVCKEHYANGVDSFMIVSSDSDYYGLMKNLPTARFLVFVQHEKVGKDFKRRLTEEGITYCYIDDFYSGSSLDLTQHALIQGLRKAMSAFTDNCNVKNIMNDLYRTSGVHMTDAEKKQFYDRFVKTMQISIDDSGTVSLVIGPKK